MCVRSSATTRKGQCGCPTPIIFESQCVWSLDLDSETSNFQAWKCRPSILWNLLAFFVFTVSTSTPHLNKCLCLLITPYLFLTGLIRNWTSLCCSAGSMAPGHQLSRNGISWLLFIRIPRIFGSYPPHEPWIKGGDLSKRNVEGFSRKELRKEVSEQWVAHKHFPPSSFKTISPLRSDPLYLTLSSLKLSQSQWICMSYVDSHQHSSQSIILTQI